MRANVRLHQGLDTRHPSTFLAETDEVPIALLHIDTDTYTQLVHLEVVETRLREADHRVDELIGYPNWMAHEAKALGEVLKREASTS